MKLSVILSVIFICCSTFKNINATSVSINELQNVMDNAMTDVLPLLKKTEKTITKMLAETKNVKLTPLIELKDLPHIINSIVVTLSGIANALQLIVYNENKLTHDTDHAISIPSKYYKEYMKDIPKMVSDLHDAMMDLISVKSNAQSLIKNQNSYRIPTYPYNFYYELPAKTVTNLKKDVKKFGKFNRKIGSIYHSISKKTSNIKRTMSVASGGSKFAIGIGNLARYLEKLSTSLGKFMEKFAKNTKIYPTPNKSWDFEDLSNDMADANKLLAEFLTFFQNLQQTMPMIQNGLEKLPTLVSF